MNFDELHTLAPQVRTKKKEFLAQIEGIIPWRRAGRTLGGGFTRMTVETRERSGMRRIVFYTLRALVLYCAVYGLWTDRGFYALLFGIALIVFWRVKKRMPYDYV